MKLATILFFLCQALALADEQPDFQVEVDPKVYPSAEFEGKGVKSGNIPPREKRPDAIPDRKDREKVFALVPGLSASLKGMDELDRDRLFVRARTRTLAELKKLYPKFDGEQLARLKKECAKAP